MSLKKTNNISQNTKHSYAWLLIRKLTIRNKILMFVICALLLLWFATIYFLI